MNRCCNFIHKKKINNKAVECHMFQNIKTMRDGRSKGQMDTFMGTHYFSFKKILYFLKKTFVYIVY